MGRGRGRRSVVTLDRSLVDQTLKAVFQLILHTQFAPAFGAFRPSRFTIASPIASPLT